VCFREISGQDGPSIATSRKSNASNSSLHGHHGADNDEQVEADMDSPLNSIFDSGGEAFEPQVPFRCPAGFLHLPHPVMQVGITPVGEALFVGDDDSEHDPGSLRHGIRAFASPGSRKGIKKLLLEGLQCLRSGYDIWADSMAYNAVLAATGNDVIAGECRMELPDGCAPRKAVGVQAEVFGQVSIDFGRKVRRILGMMGMRTRSVSAAAVVELRRSANPAATAVPYSDHPCRGYPP